MFRLTYTLSLAFLVVGGLTACNKTAEEQANRFKTMAAPCKSDGDCAKDHICREKKCTKGKRTKAEIAALKKAIAEKKAKAEAAKKAVKPGEGRMIVKICPFFKNTPESVGQITAVHQETKKRHFILLNMVTPEAGYQSEFTFYSLPLGKYDVTAKYGTQKRGRHDTVDILCDPKAKLPCRCVDEGKDAKKKGKKAKCPKKIREIEVVLPKDEMPVKKGKDGKPEKRPCDWVAE